jgi:ribosomal protein S18 acetylase RimI-like enzyme
VSYIIKKNLENMDFTRVTEMLTTAFWSPGIAIDEVLKGARHSALVVGAFDAQDRQIGYARVISDHTRFAYILDVIVDENSRRHGIGQAMVNAILADQELKDVYQWLLITRDAHEVYRKVGFQVTERPRDWMEIRKPRINPAPRAAV